MISTLNRQYNRWLLVLLIALIGFTTLGILSASLAWARGGDPIIQTVTLSADFPIYDNSPISSTERTVYFNNQTSGALTVSFLISGTPAMTLTAVPAFQTAITTSTLTSPWLVAIPYPVAITETTYLNIGYTVVNTNGLTTTATISYVQDITVPVVSIQPPPPILSLTAGSPLTLTGTAVDEGAGINSFQAAIHNTPLTSTLITTIWQSIWSVPPANAEMITITAVATDNVGMSGTAVSQTFLLDNMPPTAAITAPLQTAHTTFTVTWNGNDGSGSLAANPFTVQYRREDDPPDTWTTWYTRTSQTSASFATAEHGHSYTFRTRAFDQAANASSWQTATTQVTFYQVSIPVVMKPPITGGIQIVASRFQDITIFQPSVTLLLNVSQQPAEMKIWDGDASQEPTEGWVAFATSQTWDLPNSDQNGLRQVSVRFREMGGGGESQVATATIFYLRNGDFAEGTTGWLVEDRGLTYSVGNGSLRLGSSDYDCLNMPFGVSAVASLEMMVPTQPGFVLNFQYTIYTHDQLPDPSVTIYDAFEVYLNDTFFLRDGNPTAPLSCSNLRVISRQESTALDSFQGQSLATRFENHSRFDQFYNTYTDIERVWVSEN